MTRLARIYASGSRMGFQSDIQYRAPVFAYLLGFLIEPIVYMAVWRTVAEAQGGEVGGYTVGEITTYYIIWTLVRVFNTAHDPYAWEWRIREGRINEFLSQPLHPFHRDFSNYLGSKIVWTLAWLPIAAVLVLIFRPSISPNAGQAIAFAVALLGGFAVRFTLLYLLGMITFWTTRAGGLFEIVVAGELLLSGRLVPIDFLPSWAQSLADWMPFKWTFQFPIDVLMGRADTLQTLVGILAQIVWSVGLGFLLVLVWKHAIKRYTAVGG